VVAYIVVEAFATVGGARSFLGDRQKTYEVCPVVPPLVVAFQAPRFCLGSVSKPRLGGLPYHLSLSGSY
jgi:hypothetical protein